ncbi:F/Y-rich N-terminus-domain-containing protein [Blakeslea trispora]|nr:F/Y-rich N-terminus-domain-containing protein [Blakeslea trispora]
MNSVTSQDKYERMKRKLREAFELNEALSKGFVRAKKKIRTLTFEKNLLLDTIARLNHSMAINGDNVNDSNPKGYLIETTEDSNSETETFITLKPAHSLSSKESSQPTLTTVASAPPKRSKINRVNIKTRRVQPIERDSEGKPILPQQIGVLTVLNLGTIITDRDTFHNERYIFPVGYTVRRTYPSMTDPNSNTIITSTILDGGDGPRFHVVAADQPDEPIIANSATGAWTVVVRRSNEIRHRDHSNSASGPDYYGFKHPTIAKMIQDLPNTRHLKNYVWQNFEEMELKAAKGVMAAAEKKRDNLEHMGNANRKPSQYFPIEEYHSHPYYVQPSHPVRLNQSDEEIYGLGSSKTES